MMSAQRLEAEVRNLLMDGLDANKIARRLGVPIQRVQLAVHQIKGRDPAQAAAATRSKQRQSDRQLFGSTLSAPAFGPNSRRGSGRKT
jgi:hypothetical protein